MKLGEFLVQGGAISQDTLAAALRLQEECRPPLGEMAAARSLLPRGELPRLLEHQAARGIRFGEAAEELGLLTREAVSGLLEAQALEREKSRLGRLLVAMGALGSDTLARELARFSGGPAEEGGVPTSTAGRYRTLSGLLVQVTAAEDLDATVLAVLRAAAQCVPSDYGLVGILDSESEALRLKWFLHEEEMSPALQKQRSPDGAFNIPLKGEDHGGIFKHVVKTGRPYLSNDVTSPEERHYLEAWKEARSNVTVPIRLEAGETVGVLGLESRRRGAYGREDIEFLQILADLAAVAIRKAEIFARKEQERKVLWDTARCMQSLEQGVITTEGTRRALEQVLDICLRESGCHNGFISLLNQETGRLEVAIIKGDRLLPEGRRPTSLAPGEGVTGGVALAGKPRLVPDVSRCPEFVPFFEGIRSELAVPLVYHGTVIGVLNVESGKIDGFTPAQQRFFQTFADLYAPIVRSAQFYEFTRQKFGEGIRFIGDAAAMRRTRDIFIRAARTEANILIHGESGTGKEYLAKLIHFNSRRAAGPFEVVDCANGQPELIESDLFGHVKGAFTGAYADKVGLFELADRGTIFLDEIGDLRLDLQGKILRVLQEGTFRRVGDARTRRGDVRIIAASNKNLREMAKARGFRDDLLFRLDQVSVTLPPLRERREDILPLLSHFLRKYCAREKRALPGLDEEAVGLLWRQEWRGNIRELEHFTYKLVIFSEGDVIRGEDVRRVARLFAIPLLEKIPKNQPPETLRGEIAMALRAAREKGRPNQKRAAALLNWDKATLRSKMRRFQVGPQAAEPPEAPGPPAETREGS